MPLLGVLMRGWRVEDILVPYWIENLVVGFHTLVRKLMMTPYPGMVALHVTIIVGAFAVMAMESPLPMLAALVVLKIVIDLAPHRREHRNEEPVVIPAEPA